MVVNATTQELPVFAIPAHPKHGPLTSEHVATTVDAQTQISKPKTAIRSSLQPVVSIAKAFRNRPLIIPIFQNEQGIAHTSSSYSEGI